MANPRYDRLFVTLLFLALPALATAGDTQGSIYPVGELPPRASRATVGVGDAAPLFTLPSVAGGEVSLEAYRGRNNVVLSFVPAAWTPVCSTQWPQYHAARSFFEEHDTVLLGVTVDNLPTLYAWTRQLSPDGQGFWFPVLSDFHPHGAVSAAYGLLRTDGTSERALVVIDKGGTIRHLEVMDINRLPHFSRLAGQLVELN